MSGIDGIKAKIKKLLALSGSPNSHEAAAALEMAQKLMAEYQIGQDEINLLDISEESAPTVRREKTPRYENLLTRRIAGAFGCESLYVTTRTGECVWKFIGLKHRAQIAAFMGQVLLRRLRAARAEYVKSLYRVRSRYRKTQRADDFCVAWVIAVTKKLSAFAGCSPGEEKEIELFVKKNHPNLTDLISLDRSFDNPADWLNGKLAGGAVQLQHGVGAFPGSPLLTGRVGQ